MLEFLQPLQEMKSKVGVEGGTEKVWGGQGVARKAQEGDKEERRERERLVLRKLPAGSCLSNYTHQSATFADVLLQSSCPINSIQPGRKRLLLQHTA